MVRYVIFTLSTKLPNKRNISDICLFSNPYNVLLSECGLQYFRLLGIPNFAFFKCYLQYFSFLEITSLNVGYNLSGSWAMRTLRH
jgi:hypothetical protein